MDELLPASDAVDFVRRLAIIAPTTRGEEELRHRAIGLVEEILKRRHIAEEVRLEENVLHGRTDARIGLLVFEFKEFQKLDASGTRKDAVEKMRSVYFTGYVKKGLPKDRLVGMITDGWTATALAYDPDEDTWTRVDPFGAPLSNSVPFYSLSDYAVWLEGAFNGLAYQELTPENLLESFGPGTALGQRTVKALWEAFADSAQADRKTKFFEQWKILFSIATQDIVPPDKIATEVASYGLDRASIRTDEEVRRFLFIVHTYYALLLKLLAVRVIDELRLGGPTSVIQRIKEDADRGIKFAEETIPRLAVNVIEGDVFSWIEGSWTIDLKATVGEMATRFERFDVGGVRRDVLKRVYQNVIPPKLRKALGEFYTKDWTAELVLDQAGFTGVGRVLDPSCGSGTFLALAIQRAKRAGVGKDPSIILSSILGSIVGFDVNPVAIATARINYLLSILDLLQAARPAEGISLPVYLCDSVVLPSVDPLSPGSGVFWVNIAAWKDPVGVPVPPSEITEAKTSDPVRILLRVLNEQTARSESDFIDSVTRELGVRVVERYAHELRELHKILHTLELKKIDGIWALFILNFFAPVFERKFDFVVGNPPWVAPRNTPEAYLKKVAGVIKGSGYQEEFKPKFDVAVEPFASLGRQYVACLPFEYMALTRYVAPGGTIAFLLTSSLMKSLNAGGWRQRVVAQGLQAVVDLSMLTDIHEGASSWAFVPVLKQGAPTPPHGIEFKFATRKASPLRRRKGLRRDPERPPILSWDTWRIKAAGLRLLEADERSPWLVGDAPFSSAVRRMQKSPILGNRYPGYQGIHTSGGNETYFLSEIEKTSPRLFRFLNDGGEAGLAESEVIYPLIRGAGVRAWKFETSYMLLPHLAPDFKAVGEDKLKGSYPEAWRYFHARRQKLSVRPRITPSVPYYNVLYLSHRKIDTWKVAFPEVSPMVEASVVPPTIDDKLLGVRHVIPDHKVYYFAVGSEAEAHYLAGILNSSFATAFASQLATPKGGIPWRDYHQWNLALLPLPPFKESDANCEAVTAFSKRLHADPSSWTEKLRSELDRSVSKLYGLNRAEVKALARNLAMLSRGLLPANIASLRQRKREQRIAENPSSEPDDNSSSE